jgi:hypothetical protein
VLPTVGRVPNGAWCSTGWPPVRALVELLRLEVDDLLAAGGRPNKRLVCGLDALRLVECWEAAAGRPWRRGGGSSPFLLRGSSDPVAVLSATVAPSFLAFGLWWSDCLGSLCSPGPRCAVFSGSSSPAAMAACSVVPSGIYGVGHRSRCFSRRLLQAPPVVRWPSSATSSESEL